MKYEKKQFIKDLKTGMDISDIFVVVEKSPLLTYKSGYRFEMKLADKTGEIWCKYWGSNNIDDMNEVYAKISVDDVIYIEGKTNTWNKKIDISINPDNEFRILQKDEYYVKDFIEAIDNIDEKFKELLSYTNRIDDESLKKLVIKIITNNIIQSNFMKSPATTFSHHSYAGGLLKHTLNVLKISLYLNGLYENTNRDLLICGAILHDIGKIEEFKITTSIKETKKSVLLGHEILGIHIIQNVINELDISTELTNKLYHIVSKHHTEAKFIEAKIIKHANELDSEVDLMIKLKEWGKEKTNHFSIQTEDFGELYLE